MTYKSSAADLRVKIARLAAATKWPVLLAGDLVAVAVLAFVRRVERIVAIEVRDRRSATRYVIVSVQPAHAVGIDLIEGGARATSCGKLVGARRFERSTS